MGLGRNYRPPHSESRSKEGGLHPRRLSPSEDEICGDSIESLFHQAPPQLPE